MALSDPTDFPHQTPTAKDNTEEENAAMFNEGKSDNTASRTRSLIDEGRNGPSPAGDRQHIPNRRILDQTHSTDDQTPGPSSATTTEELPALFNRDELVRIASSMSHRNATRSPSSKLSRSEPGFNIQRDYAAIDATSGEFDLNKWLRVVMEEVEENNIRQRQTGVTFKQLSVSGSGRALNLQSTVSSVLLSPFQRGGLFDFGPRPHKRILHDVNGTVKEGELLLVLGRPGSGCSTLLKTIAGQYRGLEISERSSVRYSGIAAPRMHRQFKGEVLYNQEVDKHFPHLTVGQTLDFAAAARSPRNRPGGTSPEQYVSEMRNIVMAVFGLSHTVNTIVGDDFIRGVSGGERKRVSIAEMALSRAPFACWDNSTRGLDAASALDFVQCLRLASNMVGSSSAVAIYQASQAIYEQFDKVIVLYEGREVFFGSTTNAKQYFETMGYTCPERQTTGDFLTSVTNPRERVVREGFQSKVPRTSDEFERYWKASQEFFLLLEAIQVQEKESTIGPGGALSTFEESRKGEKSTYNRRKSPYTLSLPGQVALCTKRGLQRLWNDKSSTLSSVLGTITMALIIGSIFYGTQTNTASLFQKGGILFFAILVNALNAINDINSLYAKRPIIEKQVSYAFCRPSSEALAGIVTDIPVKTAVAICFNLILYFLGNLRREPGPFFIFFLVTYVANFTMSFVFKTIGAMTKSISQAMTFAGVLVLAIIIYTGFTIPRPYMHPWFKWISWVNPVAYAFEALLVNELHGQQYACSSFVPSYTTYGGTSFVCASQGAQAGHRTVSGDDFLLSSYQYRYDHLWRNLGFLIAFMVFFLVLYLLATELNSSTDNSAEVLIFRRGRVPKTIQYALDPRADVESPAHGDAKPMESSIPTKSEVELLPAQRDIFTWSNLNYEIQVQGGRGKLLDHVSGWVRPGTLTALMGVSGAGKTTLLDVLALRKSVGVVTGNMLVNGQSLDASFQRNIGYVQQQDLHLETSTVREALRFSAMLRQPQSVSTREKDEYVDKVIEMLDMSEFSEAVVGVPGEGLNVEQRKLLTIGVELAAKPALLLFLDEPTSGLDSQSAWAIVSFLRKLADQGQAVLSTIHQPSSLLFQQFDRLLFLAKGGRPVYFGDIGPNSETLCNYFEKNGAHPCGKDENPAEWILSLVGTGDSSVDWPRVWQKSPENEEVRSEIESIHRQHGKLERTSCAETITEFAIPFPQQLYHTIVRVFQQYWRTPSYIWAKLLLGILAALFIGFSFFKADGSQQGLQNVMFSIFMLTSIFTTLVQQIIPRFVIQRSLYEVREKPSKAYSWAAFLIANIIVEIPWQILLSVVVFVSYYYPVGFWQYADPEFNQRAVLMFLYILEFFLFTSTFAQMVIVALPDEQTAGAIATLMFSLTLTFNGVIQTPQALPGFWIFMYRVSPLTYPVSGMLSSGLHSRPVACAASELSVLDPPANQSCGQYLANYLAAGAPGQLLNPQATTRCQYCPLTTADQYLANISMSWTTRWRNVGIMAAYIVFNVAAAVGLYYAFRVRKWRVWWKHLLWLGVLWKVCKRSVVGREGGLLKERGKGREVQPRVY